MLSVSLLHPRRSDIAFMFLTLPPEIRCVIYDLLFSGLSIHMLRMQTDRVIGSVCTYRTEQNRCLCRPIQEVTESMDSETFRQIYTLLGADNTQEDLYVSKMTHFQSCNLHELLGKSRRTMSPRWAFQVFY